MTEGDVLPVRPQGRWLQFAAARASDQRILSSWTGAGSDASDVKRDSVELAEMAFKKWRAAARDGSIAHNLQDLERTIERNTRDEVTVLLLARARWLRTPRLAAGVAGICAFHRTWSNNICPDFLAVHPQLTRRDAPRPDRPKGVGGAMLWYLALLAHKINAGAIWGEATAGSHGFYTNVFKKPITDLIFVTKEEYTAFSGEMESRVAEKERNG